ncbi:MAG: discoidin domain-containing protein, partial [Bryobacteraceae bacterium]
RQAGLLVVAGLLAGFAYAIKYTAGVAVPYAVLFVLWKSFRKRQGFVKPVLIVGLFAAVMIAPWMVKNWLFVGNPVAPFYNRWFPNPALQAGFEQSYREILENWGGVKNKLEIPLEVTVGGSRLQGLIGPAFLLAPIALFALRYRAGRQALLAAGVFLLTYPSNIGTRFLIPALPFVALGMGMTLANWKPMAPLVIALHALTCWPWMMETYCGQYAMRIERIPVAAALRLEPEEHYLDRRMSSYAIARMLDEKVPPEATVLAYDGPPTAYHSRKVLVSYEGSLNHNLCDMLWAVRITEWQPKRRLTFRFPGQPLRRVRVVQTAKGSTDYWSISEFHALLGGKELPREAEWRLRARPNPWEVQMAFDGDPMTRWRSWQPISAGDYVELDFGRTNKVDAVVLDTTPDQWAVRLRLDGQPDGGAWRTLSGEPEAAMVAPPSPLRRTLSRELRWQGVEYVLIMDSDFIAADVAAHLAEWGWTQVDARNGARLYRVE